MYPSMHYICCTVFIICKDIDQTFQFQVTCVTLFRNRPGTFLKYASVRYIIFCGAPAHFTGVFGKEKMAFPSLKFCKAFHVFSTVLTE